MAQHSPVTARKTGILLECRSGRMRGEPAGVAVLPSGRDSARAELVSPRQAHDGARRAVDERPISEALAGEHDLKRAEPGEGLGTLPGHLLEGCQHKSERVPSVRRDRVLREEPAKGGEMVLGRERGEEIGLRPFSNDAIPSPTSSCSAAWQMKTFIAGDGSALLRAPTAAKELGPPVTIRAWPLT
jgi:hypothetical protein